MKHFTKTIITLGLIINFIMLHAQPQSITLTFAARDANYGDPLPLDSVQIINRTRNCDTMLFSPDTSFVLYYTVGIDNKKPPVEKEFLSECFPNPAHNGKTVFTVQKENNGGIYFNVSDIRGNVLLKKYFSILAGTNRFEMELPETGMFLLTAYDGSRVKTVKVISGISGGKECRIKFISRKNNYKNTKLSTGNPWWYEPGDTLWYVGYAKTPQEINGSDVMEDAPLKDTLVILRILEGIPCPGTVAVKYGGHLYPTVQIKERCWLKENLDIGTMISSDTVMSDNGIIEKYCYDNDPANCEVYGGLYQWNELMQYSIEEKSQGICPDGWHVPSIDEFNNMTYGYTGDDFKEKGNAHWLPGSFGLNTTGFTALPSGGWDYYNKIFRLITKDAPFFTSTKLGPPSSDVYFKEFVIPSVIIWGNAHITDGLALRCIKDENK